MIKIMPTVFFSKFSLVLDFFKPLIQSIQLAHLVDICTRIIASKVSDYWRNNKWISLSDIDPLLKVVNLNLTPWVINENCNNQLIWSPNPSGSFTVTSTYSLSSTYDSEPFWAKAWTPSLIPKINIFY